jgi:hypothetical protein
MPRRARLSLPGIPWHIIQHGNNRSVCFHINRGQTTIILARLPIP